MNTLFDTYIKPLQREKANDIQREAVQAWLIKHGELDRDFAYMSGLPACGRIKNLGGRIHELRKEGWNIETLENPTRYKLIFAPSL